MTPTQHFKLGFLSSCVAQGVTADRGMDWLTEFTHPANQPNTRVKAAGIGQLVPSLGQLLTAGIAPAVVGAGGVYLAGAAGEAAGGGAREQQLVEPIDIKQPQKQELVAAYREQTRRIMQEIEEHRRTQADPIRKNMTAAALYGGY